MSVYVDPLTAYGFGGASVPPCFRYKASCHMYADSLDELHAMAKKIGLKREWFQDKVLKHYDLTEGKRKLAVAAGAKSSSKRHMVSYYRVRD